MKPFILCCENAVVLIQAKIPGKIVIALVDPTSEFIGYFKVFGSLTLVVFYEQRQAGDLQYKEQQEHGGPSY